MADIRNLGKAAEIFKPDGTKALTQQVATIVNQGVAAVNTGLATAKAVDRLVNGVSRTIDPPGKLATAGKNLSNIVANPLEQFASYSVMWTMACLEPSQFNNPASYRNSPSALKHVVLASAGRFDDQRVKTWFGAPEYFINNFVMKTKIAPGPKNGNTNVIAFEFDIFEPVSMGLLMQSFQNAAIKAGYLNGAMDNVPYVLRMDVMGYDELGQEYKSIKPKFFTMKITALKFSVTESGSNYKVTAVPFNHQGFADNINTTYSDLKIIAAGKGSVEEVLVTGPESLVAVLNKIEKDLVAEGRIGKADVYDIQFPADAFDFLRRAEPPKVNRSTVDPNAETKAPIEKSKATSEATLLNNNIGKSSLGFDQSSGGSYPFSKAGDTVDDKTGLVKRDMMQIDPKNRAFQFSQGQPLTAIINQIILSSEYAAKALDAAKMTKEGYINWWKLDIQMELLEYDPLIGEFAKKFTFRVVPYNVHSTVFSNPSATPVGYKEIEKKIVKEYNYIYTGKNIDVLKFDIEINNLFYTGSNPKPEAESAKASDPNSKGTVEQKQLSSQTGVGAAPAAQTANLGRPRVKKDPALMSKFKGGSGEQTTEQLIAESFHNSFTQLNSELTRVNLEILGDPYWLVDSGIGNYYAGAASPTAQITNDGTMNYESGDVFVYLTFRTPADMSEETGLYQFSVGGKESAFSGIYRVVDCENIFADGTFKQRLECMRMPGQANDYTDGGKQVGDLPVSKQNVMATVPGKEEKPKANLTEDQQGEKGTA